MATADDAHGAMVEPLTWREQEILQLLSERHTDREIATLLHLELSTVKWYNRQLYSKLGVRSRYAAARKAQDYGLIDGTSSSGHTAPATHNQPLPAPLTTFVGRTHEVESISELLETARLLTLTGAPGIGKTRLALQVAAALSSERTYADGVFFVELASVGDPDLVGAAIADRLTLGSADGRTARAKLVPYLAQKDLLLILDNFEHVLEAATLVGDLLEAAPGLRVMVTSRERLHLYGEYEFPVPPLATPELSPLPGLDELLQTEAVELFVQRARATMPTLSVTPENAQAVAEICVRLDGLPLALELAAARMKTSSAQALLGQLDNRLAALSSGPQNLPERQRTLSNLIGWSADLLSETERALFARLSVFRGGCTVEAVEKICTTDLKTGAFAGLESLLNKSLLTLSEQPSGETRFYMLQTIHEYARRLAARTEDMEELRRRHAEYFTTLAERAAPYTRGGANQFHWLRRLDAEWDNVRSALAWSLGGAAVDLGQRLVAALPHYWLKRGTVVDGRRWALRALECGDESSPEVSAAVLYTAGLMAYLTGDLTEARRLFHKSLHLYRDLGDGRNTGWVLALLGVQAIGQADEYDQAVSHVEEAREYFVAAGDKVGVAQALNSLVELARSIGDTARAKQLSHECLALARETDDAYRAWCQYINLGLLALHEGDPTEAEAWFAKVLRPADERVDVNTVLSGLNGLAGAAAASGSMLRAARLLGTVETQFAAHGFSVQPADVPDLDRIRQAVKDALGAESYETAWQEGAATRIEDAVSHALEAN